MCLIVFAWKVISCAPLIAVANRDEYYDRPTAPAAWWDDYPNVFAGRDLKAGGTWMGITRDGPCGPKFAALTNIRAPSETRTDAPSRGALVANYLSGEMTAQEYVAQLRAEGDAYNGFNLVLGDRNQMLWFSNRGGDDPRNGQSLPPGIYGISNALLDAPWPKLVRTKAQFASLLCQCAPDDAYFEMLADTTRAPDVRLPDTGIELELERLLSAVCIESSGYGTRSSAVVKLYAEAPPVLQEQTLK
ncbi:MAG: NRDE family protein [Pseudomonadota bacterium]